MDPVEVAALRRIRRRVVYQLVRPLSTFEGTQERIYIYTVHTHNPLLDFAAVV